MNPLYLAMMQQQGQQQPTPLPGMPTSAPTTPLQLMPQQTASPSYTNPFDSGITKAIEGARASIALSQAQKQDAFSKSLAAFAAALSQPHQQYWGDNPRSAMMRQIGASLAPGIQTYNQAEDQARQENLGLADYMVKLKSTQDEALRKLLKEQLDRQHQDDVLEETKRHHGVQEKKQDQLYELKKNKYASQSSNDNLVLNGKEYAPLEKRSRPEFTKQKRAVGELLTELNMLNTKYNDYRSSVKDDLVDPQTPYYIGDAANTVKDAWAATPWSDKRHTDNMVKRKAVDALNERIKLSIERKLKGGILPLGLIKRFDQKGILPSLSDRPEVFEQKMKDLVEETSHNYHALDKSLKTGYIFTPYDFVETGQPSEAKEVKSDQENTQRNGAMITMLDSDGNPLSVPPEDVDEVLKLGGRHAN